MRITPIAAIALAASSLVVPAEAVTYPVVSGHVTDTDGRPVSGLPITVANEYLTSTACTDASGFYRVRARSNSTPDFSIMNQTAPDRSSICPISQLRTIDPQRAGAPAYPDTLTIATADVTHDVVLPAILDINLSAVDDSGLPVQGVKAELMATRWPLMGATTSYDDAVLPGSVTFTGYRMSESGGTAVTGASGATIFHTFKPSEDPLVQVNAVYEQSLLAQSDGKAYPNITQEYIDSILADGRRRWPSIQVPGSYFMKVAYNPYPGNVQYEYVYVDEVIDGQHTIVMSLVPSIDVSAPSSTSAGKVITATATVAVSDVYTAAAAIRMASRFKSKKLNVYTRTATGPSTWSRWKKLGTCKVTKAGKCKKRIRIKRTTQIQFRPRGFTAALDTATVRRR